MFLHVAFEIKQLATNLTFIYFHFLVMDNFQVLCSVMSCAESFGTERTSSGILFQMNSSIVDVPVMFTVEFLATFFAGKRLISM